MPTLKSGYYKPFFSKISNLCCKLAVPATTFESNVILKTYQIFCKLNFKSCYIIYLLECLNFQIQYVEKSEAKFRIRLNNHVKDGTRRYTIIIPSMKPTLTQ